MFTVDLFSARSSDVANSRVESRRPEVWGSTARRFVGAMRWCREGRWRVSWRVRGEKALLEMEPGEVDGMGWRGSGTD
jgi:hypothetical protein